MSRFTYRDFFKRGSVLDIDTESGLSLFVNANGYDFDITFSKRVVFLNSDSGTGKTFLLNTLAKSCGLCGVPSILINYNSLDSIPELFKSIKDGEFKVVLLDNADLYLTNDLLNYIKDVDCVIVIAMKQLYNIYCEGAKVCYTELDSRKCTLYGR